MVAYDPNIIQQMADGLYKQAKGIELRYALLGLIVGGAAGYAPVLAGLDGGIFLAAGGAFLGAVMGYSVAKPKAFLLRLQAQEALCQVQIEYNTRKALQEQGQV